ncbi:MAG: alpha-L-fucosidase [Bacteroidales bacterium]|nr:alpha-L-fucosidase [Bacteroidales bacterium]
MNHIKCTGLILLAALLNSCSAGGPKDGFRAAEVVPTPEQVAYQQMEMVGFIHFTMNTFTDKEWGYGDEDPALFDPAELDAEQWVLAAKAGGLKELILTAKHHDGFCLWPSAYTEHSVKNSPYKNGDGDIVREFTDACRKHGLKAGLYLSPWDRNHADYGQPEYTTYYRNQLRELLTRYGEINEIWFDGANGGSGWYGGADEERRIDRATYYDWDSTFALVKQLQPGVQIFSDAGPDLRWIGNEHGFAGETCWSTISTDQLVIGASDQGYLNTGDPEGDRWITGQCDVSIRPGWFYHASEDGRVKTPGELMDIYYKSVGRNGVLLLNLPPDRRGLIHETDATHLAALYGMVRQVFASDLAAGAEVKTERKHVVGRSYRPGNITDADPETFWAAPANAEVKLVVALDEPRTFDHIVLQEPIRFGQRISAFRLEVPMEKGLWKEIARGTTIGYKRILQVDPVTTGEVRLVIENALYPPAISALGLYHSGENH